ncbi:hypothetical protein BGZ76_006979 [Entomortierella beljakovae]|nr:hypothetical protein BGZ76_006979 [Entomortierella beljakovae]
MPPPHRFFDQGLTLGMNYERLYLLLILLAGFYPTSTVAQSFIPTVVDSMAYVTVGEKTLYVQGGDSDPSNSDKIVNQFAALDLTKNWDVSSPPWKSLGAASGTQQAPTTLLHSITASKDQKSLIFWPTVSTNSQLTISVYNIVTNVWTQKTLAVTGAVQDLSDHPAVADPGTGLVYIPGAAGGGASMIEYNPGTDVINLLPMPAGLGTTPFNAYSIAWSTVRNSILMSNADKGTTLTIYEYNPGSHTWSTLTTTPSLDARKFSCLIPGSASNGGKFLGSLYELDIQSLTWTKGVDIQQPLVRGGMACSVAGDNFITWGGSQNPNGPFIPTTPSIYNLKSNQWVNQFTLLSPANTTGQPITQPSGSPDSGSTLSSGSSSNSSSLAPIIGGVVGAIILVIIIIIVYIVLRRRRNSSKEHSAKSEQSQSHHEPSQYWPSQHGPSQQGPPQHEPLQLGTPRLGPSQLGSYQQKPPPRGQPSRGPPQHGAPQYELYQHTQVQLPDKPVIKAPQRYPTKNDSRVYSNYKFVRSPQE